MEKVIIDGKNLSIIDFVNVSRYGAEVELSKESKEAICKARELVDDYVDREVVVYGLTTGFGKFSDTIITKEETKKLQRNLIISHSCGMGDPLSEEVVRGIMLLRINAIAKGFSGTKLDTVQTLVDMLNKGVHPVIPEKGSLGASGDLAPLSHMVLVMIGEGEAFYRSKRISGREAMEKAGIKTIELISKEGLSLINGTQVMTSIGALATWDAIILGKVADIAAALSMEALNGIIDAFDPRIHEARNQVGQIESAKHIRELLQNSKNISNQGELRVQDSYTLRCVPQVHGASKDCFEYTKDKVCREMNAATDNPLLFLENGDVISGGNFHGQPMALSFDFLGIAIAELANISERRLEKLVNPSINYGLPAFLACEGGINSGFMIVQYAAAALVSENKILAHPASVDSIPSSANQEDHVSMGTIAARKAREILKNAKNVLAMEIYAACQAIDLRGNKGLGKGTEIMYNEIRNKLSFIEKDVIMNKNIEKAEKIIFDNELIEKIYNECNICNKEV